MKKTLLIVILITTLLFTCKKNSSRDNNKILTSSLTTKEGNNTIDSNAVSQPKVTFIEIGSLNCTPCKMMQPVMKKIGEKYKNQVKIIFYDVWTQKDAPMAEKYKIRVIPTQVFLDKNGNEYYRHEGYFPFEELEKILLIQGVK